MGLQPVHTKERDHILTVRSKRLEVTIAESLININKKANQVQNGLIILKRQIKRKRNKFLKEQQVLQTDSKDSGAQQRQRKAKQAK